MAITLPQIIQKYVDSSNRHDVQSILSCFSDDRLCTMRQKRCTERKLLRTGLRRQFRNINSISIISASNRTLRKSLSKWKYPERSMEARLFLIIILSSRETKFCRSQLVNSEP